MNRNTIGYVIIIILLSITCVLSIKLFFRSRTDRDILDIHTFPYTVGAWKGKDLEITEKEYRILETRNLISREYVNPEQKKLYFFIVYSETNRSVFHPPEVCLMGSGITISAKKTEIIDIDGKRFTANKLYLERKNARDIALYSYKAGNLYTDNFFIQQAYFALNQVIGKRRGGATIRVAMPIGETEKITLAVLKSFMTDAIKALEKL